MTVVETSETVDIRFGAAPRTPGVHVSTILRDIALKIGVFKDEDEDEEMCTQPGLEGFSLIAVLRMALGLAWEEWFSKQAASRYPGLVFHFGELHLDGIWLTPDAFDVLFLVLGQIHEFKVTWKSAARKVADQWYWVTQLKAYCHAMGVLAAVLWVYYVNGDYRHGYRPEFKRYEFTFTPEELAANWRMIVGYRDRVQPEN